MRIAEYGLRNTTETVPNYGTSTWFVEAIHELPLRFRLKGESNGKRSGNHYWIYGVKQTT